MCAEFHVGLLSSHGTWQWVGVWWQQWCGDEGDRIWQLDVVAVTVPVVLLIVGLVRSALLWMAVARVAVVFAVMWRKCGVCDFPRVARRCSSLALVQHDLVWGSFLVGLPICYPAPWRTCCVLLRHF